MKTRRVCVLVVLLALFACHWLLATSATLFAELGAGWTAKGGDWGWTREIIPMIRQGSDTGTAVAFCIEVNQAQGAWRATVAPALLLFVSSRLPFIVCFEFVVCRLFRISDFVLRICFLGV